MTQVVICYLQAECLFFCGFKTSNVFDTEVSLSHCWGGGGGGGEGNLILLCVNESL